MKLQIRVLAVQSGCSMVVDVSKRLSQDSDMAPPTGEVESAQLGAVVARQRAALGLTQKEAAKLADVSPTTWRDLEKGRGPIQVQTADRVRRVLGWTWEDFETARSGQDPDPLATLKADLRWAEQRVAELQSARPVEGETAEEHQMQLDHWRRAVDELGHRLKLGELSQIDFQWLANGGLPQIAARRPETSKKLARLSPEQQAAIDALIDQMLPPEVSQGDE